MALLVAAVLAGCTSGASSSAPPSGSSSGSAASGSPTPRHGSGTPVHISLFENDGQTFGVGMPIIAYFDKKVTDASVFDQVATVIVNGRPAGGAWYWEPPSRSDAGIEAHYRP